MSEVSPSLRRRWLVLAPALLLPFCASFFYFVLFPGTAFGNSFYTGIKFYLLAWPFIATGWVLREPFLNRNREKHHVASLWPGIAFGLLVVGLLFFLLKGTPLGSIIDDNQERMSERIHGLGVAENFLWFALFISFLHAALEEFYWRWFVFGQAIRTMRVGTAYVVSSLGFASHHIVILSQFFPLGWAIGLGACVGIGGAVWAWIYRKTGSLVGPWLSHMIVDLGLMWVGWEVLQMGAN